MTTAAQRSGSNASVRVRASRDGDRFHYTWAAARLLQLLSPVSELQQVTVEGLGETRFEEELDGSEVVDLTEFYGVSQGKFTSLEVRQFKHSTLHPDENFTLGEVCKVFSKFAQLDNELREKYPDASVRFSIVTNKPIAPEASVAVRVLASGELPETGSSAAKLRASAALTDAEVKSLCSRLNLRGREPGVTALRRGLHVEIGGLTTGVDPRVSASLVDLVASRASTESDGPIVKADVLAAFGCREDELAPAPCLLDDSPFIMRDVYKDLADKLLETPGSMVITAEGGVGKSTFARALPELLSDRANVIIYDCFGNGSYRNPARPRHRHKDGFVQLATEIAGLGLCFPIIPMGNLSPEDYTKAFVLRLDHASEMLTNNGKSHLVIVIDAADNAVIAAEDNADSRAFVRDLLRLNDDIPSNIHIVLTCRPERLHLLEALEDVVEFKLPVFTREETALVVSNLHSSVTARDVDEIHDRTAGNPRVISTVLNETQSIQEALGRLSGFTNTTPSLDSLLYKQVTKAFNNAGGSQEELKRVAQLLTLLRPSVPLDVLAELAGTQVSSVRSFISDLGRGLVLDGQNVQFLDEPTETYFRTRHKTTQEFADQVVSKLRTLSGTSAYAALSLPEVLWSAKQYDELLALVATDHDLPSTSQVERIQVEYLRVEFGLRAAIRLRRSDSIVQLALRAGSIRAGKGRQFTVIKENPDLAGLRMDPRVIGELIASRELRQSWPGSTLGTEAVLLAHTKGGTSTARSRARQAVSGVAAWVNRQREMSSLDADVTAEQVAHISLAILRTDEAASAAQYLSRWEPAEFVLEVSAVLARMLISCGNDEDVLGLIANCANPAILLGVFGEMQRVGMIVEEDLVNDAWRSLQQFSVEDCDYWITKDTVLRGVAWICALAVRYSIADAEEAAERLCEYLPPSLPSGLDNKYRLDNLGLIFAVALLAELMNEVLNVGHYRAGKVPAKQSDYNPVKSKDTELDRNLRPALTWLSAWAKYARGNLDPQVVLSTINSYPKNHSQDRSWSIVSRIAQQVLALLSVAFFEESVADACERTIQTIIKDDPIGGAINLIPGLRGDSRFESAALELSNAACSALVNATEQADFRAETLMRIGRALYRFSQDEAGSYFDQSVEIAAGIGEDTIHRWEAIVSLTGAVAGLDSRDGINLAARVARLGEAVNPIVYDEFNEQEAVVALSRVSGTNILRIISQWRDRRFGSLGQQFEGLVEGNDALFAQRPDLTVVLAPFSTSLDLNAALCKLKSYGNLDDKILSSVNNLALRLGRSLHAQFRQTSLPDPPRTQNLYENRSTIFGFLPDKRKEKLAQIKKCKVKIEALDLTRSSDISMAVRLQSEADASSDNLFIAEVFSRSELQWGPILDAALSSEISRYELTKLLNEALVRSQSSMSRSFVESLKRAIKTYVKQYGAQLLQSQWVDLDLCAAADLLGERTTDLLQRALNHLNIEEALIDAQHCYSLAAGASAVLDPPTAARLLDEAVTDLENELGIDFRVDAGWQSADPIDVAVANFLWAALGDPRAAVRWQAAHAVRTAIEIGAENVLAALGSAVVKGDPAGYIDERFPFYQMSAAEWFLIAVERVAHDDPFAIDALIPVVAELSDRYPDHATIQRHCFSISQLLAVPADHIMGTDWNAELRDPVDPERFRRPTHPAPMMKGAPKAEHRFYFDFDQYVLGELTKTLHITHQKVLDAASALILDEWGWRGRGEYEEDPRHIAAVYEEGETYGYKSDVPKAETFRYYLERHATLTIAGRLMRTVTPYCDPDAEQPDVLEWLADFDIVRDDGRWITDQRSMVPGAVAIGGTQEISELDESTFLAALMPADGWVTIWQYASVTDANGFLSVDISSALVDPATCAALVRALQTGEGYWSFRLPSVDPYDEKFQFFESPFQLRGWITKPDSKEGIDWLDPFTTKLQAVLPSPSSEVAGILGVTSKDGGARWETDDGNLILASETWADMKPGYQYGSSGYRLRIRTEALDKLLGRLDVALVIDVCVKRQDRQYRNLGRSENTEEGGDDYEFRVFSYQPGAGWSDYGGRVGTR